MDVKIEVLLNVAIGVLIGGKFPELIRLVYKEVRWRIDSKQKEKDRLREAVRCIDESLDSALTKIDLCKQY